MENGELRAGESEFAALKYRRLTGVWRWIGIAFPVIVLFLVANQTFDWRFFIDYMLYDYTLYYLILALLLSLAFLECPVKPGLKGVWARRLFRTDVFLFFLIFGIGLYFAMHGMEIIIRGWVRVAPVSAIIMAVILWFLIVEAVRRVVGGVLAVVVLFTSLYPLFAQYMPGILNGESLSLPLAAQFHLLGSGSVMGILMRIYVQIIMCFTFFGTAVLATGGGKFFLDLALSLVGRTRGGTAKVAVFASAMFGSLSGSSEVNVITTGCVTIPAMKKSGFASHVAGAVEVCASTAGTFTPPIMGGTAFVLASFIGLSYAYVALAAAIPAILFYIGLYTQVDGYAAKEGLQGLPKEECPSFIKTLKYGWFYIPVGIVLVYYLFVLRLVGESAFISATLMLVLAQIRKETRFTRASFLMFLENTGQTLAFLLIATIGVAMLLGSFSATGLAVTFARELLFLAGGNLALILILCSVASIIMGMGMTTIACYVFLAIVIAPAMVMVGLDELAVHLFILYFGMLSYLTPPVAMCAFPAAAIAKDSAMKIAITAVRLGAVLFIVPFFFVLDPGLILRGDIGHILLVIPIAALAVFLIGSALEGYMIGIGRLWPARGDSRSVAGYSLHSYPLRVVLVVSGILLGLPWMQIKVLGAAVAAIILVPTFIIARRQRSRGRASPIISVPANILTDRRKLK